MANIDTSELDGFAQDLLRMANDELPTESKKFLRQEATKLRKKTLNKAKSLTNKQTGNYYKGIKKGKVYHYKDKKNNSIRVYGGSSHAHLIEYGHRQVVNPPKEGKVAPIGNGNFAQGVRPGRGIGTETGFVEGLNVFEKAKDEFESEFNSDCEEFIQNVVLEGLSK